MPFIRMLVGLGDWSEPPQRVRLPVRKTWAFSPKEEGGWTEYQ